MSSLFTTGRVADIALAALVLEALVLLATRRRHGLTWADVAGQVGAGAFLLLALRGALTGMAWGWIALFLAASLPAHLFDLVSRVRRAPWPSGRSV